MKTNELGKAVAIVAACVCGLVGCTEKPVAKSDMRPLVKVGAVSNGVVFADALRVQGLVRAKDTASVAARVPGTIDELCVEEGARVTRGDVLFRIDRVNLANAVRAAKDDLAMAKAKLDQAVATEAKAKVDAARMARLLADGAVTKDMCEKADVAAKSQSAALGAARASVTKAETGLAVAEKNFADSEVRAPFDGILTKRFRNAGDFCGAGMKVFELENAAVYELCLSLSAEHYARVTVGRTEIESRGKLPVTYKAPSVDRLTRTFEVRAAIPKTPEIAAGMLVDCRVVFARRTSQAVPASAVADRGGSTCVYKVSGGKVVRVPVVAGLSANGLREILSPAFSSDDAIILEGMLLVNENDAVRVVE